MLALNIIVVITFENAKHQVMKKAIKRKVYIRDTPHSNGNESVKSYFADLVCTTEGTPPLAHRYATFLCSWDVEI